ncbi:MAG: hypothetical protein IJN27_05660 [Oscillospiraceae bacterium]|nr:hypothetical protein [Oscillospiraceae bacterium]
MTEIFRKKKTQQEIEIDNLKKELDNCRFLMMRNEIHFNMASDENLIASQIYERESLRCQYNYLLRQLKEKENCAVASEKVKVGE